MNYTIQQNKLKYFINWSGTTCINRGLEAVDTKRGKNENEKHRHEKGLKNSQTMTKQNRSLQKYDYDRIDKQNVTSLET